MKIKFFNQVVHSSFPGIDYKYLDNHRQKVDGELTVNDLRTFLKSR